MRLNAAIDKANCVAWLTAPPVLCNSLINPAYWLASVSTATSFQFFAAERTIAGPPISIFSMASSSVQLGWATVASNGYKLTTTMSILGILAAFMADTCSGKSRRPKMPPCTFGCSVLTRPSNISVKPV